MRRSRTCRSAAVYAGRRSAGSAQECAAGDHRCAVIGVLVFDARCRARAAAAGQKFRLRYAIPNDAFYPDRLGIHHSWPLRLARCPTGCGDIVWRFNRSRRRMGNFIARRRRAGCCNSLPAPADAGQISRKENPCRRGDQGRQTCLRDLSQWRRYPLGPVCGCRVLRAASAARSFLDQQERRVASGGHCDRSQTDRRH